MPKVSVIIPVYNRTIQLKAAIDSVLVQTFSDFELIVIDDGSTINIEEFIPEDKRLRLIRQKNRGVSFARNVGIKIAQGKYICLLDSDDVWLPTKLEKQIKYMEQHSDYLISQTEDIWIRNGKRVNPHKKHQKKEGNIFLESLQLCLISPSAVIIRKELFDQVGLFDEALPACEDYELWLRVTKDYPVGLLEEPLIIRYAGHSDQLSSKYPVMDRFRIRGLKKLLYPSPLAGRGWGWGNKMIDEGMKIAAVYTVIKQKSRIIAAGALKRGKLFTWLYYKYFVL